MLLNSTVTGVVLMNVVAVLLVVGRAMVFRTRLYRPMLLNVALSVAPVLVLAAGLLVLAVLLAAGAPVGLVGTLAVVVLLGWLLLLPNAGYLITELNLSHRREGDGVPEWYDVLLVLTLAMSGVLNTLVNVFLVQLLYVALRFDDVAGLRSTEVRAVVAAVLVLVALGVYLGRALRLNSWDALHPGRLARALVAHLRAPGAIAGAVGFTVLGAVFFGLMYLVVVGPLVAGVVELGSRS